MHYQNISGKIFLIYLYKTVISHSRFNIYEKYKENITISFKITVCGVLLTSWKRTDICRHTVYTTQGVAECWKEQHNP